MSIVSVTIYESQLIHKPLSKQAAVCWFTHTSDPVNGNSNMLTWRNNQRFILMLNSTFELPQKPTRFILASQIDSVELLFMFADQCLNVNKSLNWICSSYKAIVFLQKIWTYPLNPYGFVYNLFMTFLKLQSGSCVAVNEETERSQISSKRYSFVFRRWTKVLCLEWHESLMK